MFNYSSLVFKWFGKFHEKEKVAAVPLFNKE